MKKLSNITLKEFRSILTALGLHKMRTKGGHEAWVREGLKRTVIIQTHVDPVSELVVRKTINDLGISREEFIALLEKL
ncbi:MAG: type II toxin-antitoxin system HicA family toxin [Bacteroidales bacterium]|nr:type II toxin-antitoxin system HicA family toxin [Bacteroidales bacterium]